MRFFCPKRTHVFYISLLLWADYDGSHDFNNIRALALLRRRGGGNEEHSVPIVSTLVGMASTTGMGYRYGDAMSTWALRDETSSSSSSSSSSLDPSCLDEHATDAIDYSIVDAAVAPPEAGLC